MIHRLRHHGEETVIGGSPLLTKDENPDEYSPRRQWRVQTAFAVLGPAVSHLPETLIAI